MIRDVDVPFSLLPYLFPLREKMLVLHVLLAQAGLGFFDCNLGGS